MADQLLQQRFAEALERRARIGTLRTLHSSNLQSPNDQSIDFFSNDYLGFARSSALHEKIQQRKQELLTSHPSVNTNGSTGSRLISGNTSYFMQVERELATFYRAEAALLFNSGYAANMGVLASLPLAHDYVLYDAYIHNSCHEGIRLSRSYASRHTQSFEHNNLDDLRAKLIAISSCRPANAMVFIVVESIYSMDGDQAPLEDLVALCETYHASLIIDEAHGVGVYGPHGSGLVQAEGLETCSVICCRIYTFGKAMGCHGAVVCGSQLLIDYLVNYARSFIYTTSFPLDQLIAIQCVHEHCAIADDTRQRVLKLVQYFKKRIQAHQHIIPPAALLSSDSPIQGVVFEGNHALLHATEKMQALGIHVIPIRSPTVPKGSERFRIILHAHNTEQEIDQLIHALAQMFYQSIGRL